MKNRQGIYNANEIRARITRKKILELVAQNYVMSASLVSHTLLLSYATVLRHLRILNEEGYIELYKQGRTLYAKLKENTKELKQIQIMNSQAGPFLFEHSSHTQRSHGEDITKAKES